RRKMPDATLLDLMLPGKDGSEIYREIRTLLQVPIIMVTERVREVDRLLGQELGADDYICNPVNPPEEEARLQAVPRRAQPGAAAATEQGPLRVDAERFEATLHGERLDLTAVEFRLLQTLDSAPGRVFSRDQLMERIYPDHRVVGDRTVDSHVKNLRRKLA